jgi:hypothetical protein
MTLVGYKDPPQGSVLSPFQYNIIGSCADRFIPSGCGFLQYADVWWCIVYVYGTQTVYVAWIGLVQTACTSVNVLFCFIVGGYVVY